MRAVAIVAVGCGRGWTASSGRAAVCLPTELAPLPGQMVCLPTELAPLPGQMVCLPTEPRSLPERIMCLPTELPALRGGLLDTEAE